MVVDGLEKRQVEAEIEIERLQRSRELGDFIGDLPQTCVEDLVSEERMRHVKQSALKEALDNLKNSDKSRDQLIDKIEELEQRQRSAYLRLYEKVGNEIDMRMHKTLGMREKEIRDEQERMAAMNANDIAMTGLRQQADESRRSRKETATLNDLFRKYNI